MEAIASKVEKAAEGHIAALPVYAQLRELAEFIDEALKDEAFVHELYEELLKEDKSTKGYGEHAYTLTGKTSYSFKHIPEIAEAEAIAKAAAEPYVKRVNALKELAKQAYKLDGKALVDTLTGEVIAPAHATYSQYIKKGKA